MFSENKDFEVVKHGVESILKINYINKEQFPSLEDDAIVMRDTVKRLVQQPSVTKLIFVHNKNYEYNFNQVSLLREVAVLYSNLLKQHELFTTGQLQNQDEECVKLFFNRYAYLQNTILKDLPADPIGTYVKLTRKHRDYRFETTYQTSKCVEVDNKYEAALEFVIGKMEELSIIKGIKENLSGHKVGDREIYKQFFDANIKPNFIYTSLLRQMPIEAKELDSYQLSDASVTIFEMDKEAYNLYHITPLEFTLSEEKYNVLNLAREVIAEHKPESNDFIDPQRLREVFFNISRDLIAEIAQYKNVELTPKETDQLATILIRYTVGFGLIETLLEDERIQDISVNAPPNKAPIFLTHSDFEDCKTNIIPEQDEVEGWASRLRMISGKPLDASNPILDTEVETPYARARVSVVGKPLNPYGLGFSFRRHRNQPWTLPLFIKQDMITPEAAGLLSFLVDGARSLLIAGTRGSGKSSFLTALMIEIMRKYRIISVEDSVTGDTRVYARTKYGTSYLPIEQLFHLLAEKQGIKKEQGREVIPNPDFSTVSMNNEGKTILTPASKLIRHKVEKPIYEVTTAIGNKIKVTGDHSLFTIAEDTVLKEAKVSSLKKGDYLALPKKIPSPGKERKVMSLFEALLATEKEEKIHVRIKNIDKEDIKKRGIRAGYSKAAINRWIRVGTIPCSLAKKKDTITAFKKSNAPQFMPSTIELDEDFLSFIGLWIADGCYDRRSVILSVSSKEEQALVRKIGERFGLETHLHHDKFSSQFHSWQLKYIMRDILELNGNAYSKKIPSWIFGLSKKQKRSVLKGLFSGDGCVGNHELIISLASPTLLQDIQSLLLEDEILMRINHRNKKGKTYPDRTKDGRISEYGNINRFSSSIGFLQEHKKQKLNELAARKPSDHDKSDIIPLPLPVKEWLTRTVPRNIFNGNDYIKRDNKVGRRKLQKVITYLEKEGIEPDLQSYLRTLCQAEIFWDPIVSIRKVNGYSYVYDISVPTHENFIANNILAHNTLELPTLKFAELGFNIQPMSVRSALSVSNEGMSADMGIRSTLRLGDSCLIVGEVRSTEALALYEAMRVGALANVVAGTIHGDSPYGVYDRLVNDLGVPNTSFKATDIIIVANPVRSADGLHRNRRITQITEIRKNWEKDPFLENGFQDLFKYNTENDRLEVTDDLINGESDILKSIGGNVKQWAGNWDAIWDNITLRSNIKKLQIKYADYYELDELLEAKAVIDANDMFHKISEKVNEEDGYTNSEKIYFEFEEWFKGYARQLYNEKMS